ncbi:unnamed protein product (macronuclear) [Paramecium tetraurelia]|uniref:Transmembrane protein n=1 Tax=Paramecium tetraurelia TaxID=5888 RepID=A0CF48_PARTE|nr:uncharacterized protein GSPATT00037854001 [Paramecium tetraurelia]CAK69415.1 unnamed protein product [Paramecium tetraurelia]|eukprot:XP_001436812.1 hypothetical protein (macronuclear) [Paramecium tetraurelia strain d4-2]
MLKLLENLDQFGAAFQPSFKYWKYQHKTAVEGIMSIVLYGLSFAYLIYLLTQWSQGQTLPKVTTTQRSIKNYVYNINETYVQFETRKLSLSIIDPFDPNAIVLQPIVYIFQNGMIIDEPQAVNYPIQRKEGFIVLNISKLSLQISEERSDETPEIEVMIALGQCQKLFLLEGYNGYFSQPANSLLLRQFVQEFNTNGEVLENIGREQFISIQQNYTFQIQTFVRMQETTVDTGALFEQMQQYNFIVDYRMSNSILDLNYFGQILTYNVYMTLYYKIDNIQQKQIIIYPKLSEVLAEAGSIASTLLLISYLVVILNESQLYQDAINYVISLHFPDFAQVKIKKNIFGQIIQVERDGKQLDLNAFKTQYSKLKRISQIKLSISNQIYELSRIQIILQTIFSSQFMSQSHQKGIPLTTSYLEPYKEEQHSIVKLEMNINQENLLKQNQIIPASVDSLIEKKIQQEGFQLKQQPCQQDNSKGEVCQAFNLRDKLQLSYDVLLQESDFDLLTMPIQDSSDQDNKIK